MYSLYARSFARSIISSTSRVGCKTVRIFAYSITRAVKQKVWNEAENRERDWGETRDGRVRLARVRLLRHALPISLLILRKKPTVLQSTSERLYMTYALHLEPKLANTRLIPGDE